MFTSTAASLSGAHDQLEAKEGGKQQHILARASISGEARTTACLLKVQQETTRARLEPEILDEQLIPRTRDFVPNTTRELETPLLEVAVLLELPFPALTTPKVDDAEAWGVVGALLRGLRQRPGLAHDVAHVERALHDVHVMQAQDEREAFSPVSRSRANQYRL